MQRYQAETRPTAGCRAMSVPNAVAVIRRRASISSEKGQDGQQQGETGRRGADPEGEVPSGPGDPDECDGPSGDRVVMERRVGPAKRSPTCWVRGRTGRRRQSAASRGVTQAM